MGAEHFLERLSAPIAEGSAVEVWHLLVGCWGLVIVVGFVAYHMSRRSRVPRVRTQSGLYVKDYGTH